MGSPSSLWPRICPFSAGLFVVSAILIARTLLNDDVNDNKKKKTKQLEENNKGNVAVSFRVVFVLGAPGVGKGTQCQLLCQSDPTWCHLSAGDLLRAERQKTTGTSALADEIHRCIDSGNIVRSEITCQLLQNAMTKAYETNRCTNFLIDGYPRSQGNVDAWDRVERTNQMTFRTNVAFVLNFCCPEDTLVGRLLERGKSSGRGDDNLETIQKRFQTFQSETSPIIEWYKTKTNIPVYDIRTDKPVDRVYQDTVRYFVSTVTA